MAMNAAQLRTVNLLKTLLSVITRFYYLYMYIFYISDHKLGTCLTIFKDYQKSCCIIRVITCGRFCFSVVADITKIMHGPFSCSSVFVSVCVFNVWPKKTLLLPVWPRDAKRLDALAPQPPPPRPRPSGCLGVQQQMHSDWPEMETQRGMFHGPWRGGEARAPHAG